MPSSARNARTSCATGTTCVEADAGHRVQVDAQLVGAFHVGADDRPRVEPQGAQVGRPDHHGQLARRDLVGGTATGEGDVRGAHPLGRARRQPLLVERVAPVGLPGGDRRALEHTARPALQHGRPVPQRAQDAVTDRQEVADHVQLGQPALREVRLVGAGDADQPLPHLDLLRRRAPRHRGYDVQADPVGYRPGTSVAGCCGNSSSARLRPAPAASPAAPSATAVCWSTGTGCDDRRATKPGVQSFNPSARRSTRCQRRTRRRTRRRATWR